jgi:hypothetical protein
MKNRSIKSLAVFCGSNSGTGAEYLSAARSLARESVSRGINIVYGGASVGLMGALADEALAAGGTVTGVIPSFIRDRELAHKGLTELIVTETLYERKKIMADISDSFVALPGGFGTLDELFDIMTQIQLGRKFSPVGLLNVNGYYDSLLQFIDRTVSSSFVKDVHRDMVLSSESPAGLLDMMASAIPPRVQKWIVPEETSPQ